ALIFVYLRTAPDTGPKMRLEASLPNLTNAVLAVISPDGRAIAYQVNDQGKPHMWIRPLESDQGRALPGTEGGFFPFWSPDSRSLGFFAEGKLKRIEIAGGPARILADASNARGGAWSPNGTIIFNATSSGPLSRISPDGSKVEPATELQPDQG